MNNESDAGDAALEILSASYEPKRRSEPRHSPPCSHCNAGVENESPLKTQRSSDDKVPPMNPFDSPRAAPEILTASFPSLHIVTDAESIDQQIDNDGEAVITPTQHTRSKSVTFLAAGCGVSPLNPFDSPIKSLDVSPIKAHLGHSFPGSLHFDDDYLDDEDEGGGALKPRRHSIGADTQCSIHIRTTKEEDNDQTTQRTTISSSQATKSESNERPYPNQYRYCMCSNICMKFIRRICRPHVNKPCFLHCLPPCHKKIQPRHQRMICRSLIIIFMIITITFTLLDLLILHRYLHVWLEGALDWLADSPVAGGLVFIALILLASLCFFPVSLLALGAGFVYIDLYGLGVGITAAFLVCYSGCLLGAAVCFARSRYLMRQLIQKFANRYPIVRAVDKAFESNGFRLFFLLRLSPAMPFNALNYIGGITAVSFRDYWRATCIGILPGLLWTIFVGATFGTINARGVDGNQEFDRDSVRKGVVLGLGIGLGVMGLIGTGIYARMELTKIILAEQAAEQAESLEEESVPRPQSSHEELLADLENPQLGESHNGIGDESETNDSFLEKSDRSLHNSSFVDQKRLATPICDKTWSEEAIALELPIVPNIFRRRLGSIDFYDSPGKVTDNGHNEHHHINRIQSDGDDDKKNQSKPFEPHRGQMVPDEIPHQWEKGENNRYYLTNRPRCNTDPIGQAPISQIDTSLREDGQSNPQHKTNSIRRLHSMADFESFRETVLSEQDSTGRPIRRSSASDEGLDREWFWIWD